MNTIKRIGNALLRGWQFVTNQVMKASSKTRIVTTGLVDLLILKLTTVGTGVEPGEVEILEPSTFARIVGLIAGVAVLLAGMSLAVAYIKVVGALGAALVGSAVIGLTVFGNLAAGVVANAMTVKVISCMAFMFSAIAMNVIGSKYIQANDDEAPVDVTPAPMHS